MCANIFLALQILQLPYSLPAHQSKLEDVSLVNINHLSSDWVQELRLFEFSSLDIKCGRQKNIQSQTLHNIQILLFLFLNSCPLSLIDVSEVVILRCRIVLVFKQ